MANSNYHQLLFAFIVRSCGRKRILSFIQNFQIVENGKLLSMRSLEQKKKKLNGLYTTQQGFQ